MTIEGYTEITTGGNCRALARLIGNNKEIILTDEEGGRAPTRFPLWAGLYYLGRQDFSRLIYSLAQLRDLEALAESIA